MKYVLVLFALLVTACTTVSNAIAEDDPEFLADMARLEKLVNEDDKCSERWDIMWKWAKRGNMAVRFAIFFLMAPPPEMAPITLPGNSGNLITEVRDLTIMAVHTHDYRSKSGDDYKEEIDDYREVASEIYKWAGFDKNPRAKNFLACIKKERSQGCAEIAVKDKLVPSFDDYAAQIDAFMAQGMTSTCPASFKRIK